MKLKILSILFALLLFINKTLAEEQAGLRDLFLNNKTVICGINIRNFNSKDLNNDKIIDGNEISGNFINAIERLDEIKDANINVLHVLPITPVVKLKALGTVLLLGNSNLPNIFTLIPYLILLLKYLYSPSFT